MRGSARLLRRREQRDEVGGSLRHDSVHGRFPDTVEVDGSALAVNGKRIRLTQERDPTFVKLVAWYDNEWGYSNKCLEMVRGVAAG